MCLAIPGRIELIEDNMAVIDYGIEKRTADSSLVNVGVGDYVIVNAGFIIEKIPEKDAKQALDLIKNES
jgi:hydrogenase expression/formation protein HypC